MTNISYDDMIVNISFLSALSDTSLGNAAVFSQNHERSSFALSHSSGIAAAVSAREGEAFVKRHVLAATLRDSD